MRNRSRRMTIHVLHLALLLASIMLKQVTFCRLRQPSPACLLVRFAASNNHHLHACLASKTPHVVCRWNVAIIHTYAGFYLIFVSVLLYHFSLPLSQLHVGVCLLLAKFQHCLRKPQWTVLQVRPFYLELLPTPIHVINSIYFTS